MRRVLNALVVENGMSWDVFQYPPVLVEMLVVTESAPFGLSSRRILRATAMGKCCHTTSGASAYAPFVCDLIPGSLPTAA